MAKCLTLMNCHTARYEVYAYSHAFIILEWPCARSFLFTTVLHVLFCFFFIAILGYFGNSTFPSSLIVGWKFAVCCNSGNIFPYHYIDRAVSLLPCSIYMTRHQIQYELLEKVQFDKKKKKKSNLPPKAKKGTVENDCGSGSLLMLVSESYYAV